MAINYTTLFTQIGKLGKTINSINTYRGTTNPALVTAIFSQYSSNPDWIPTLEQDNASAQQSYSGFISSLKTVAQNTLINTVNNDNPQPDTSLNTALIELIRQMKVDSKSIQQNTVSATTTAGGSNLGDGIVNVSLKDNHGVAYQMPYAEDVVIACSADAQSGNRSVGNESFTIKGEYAIADAFDPLWPAGSAAVIGLNAIDAADSNTNSNLLVNGSFDTFTVANIPDNWSILSGAAGTEVKKVTSPVYAGAANVSFTATGTDPKIGQVFNNSSTGTGATLLPLTTYSISFWVRADSAPASGTFTIRLYDVTNAAVMNDDSSTANSLTFNLSTLTTSYVNKTAVFRTPRELPASYRLEVLCNSIATSRIIYIDHLSMATMTPLYNNGPMFCIHSGASQFILNDTFTSVIANNYTGLWETMTEQLFGLNSLQLIIPASGSPNIADSLLT